MATPANSGQPPALTASQAVALALLSHGHTAGSIHERTDITPRELYDLAALHDVTAPCGTVEGAGCHQARLEDPCPGCTTADGRARARALAAQRKAVPAHTLRHRRPAVGTA